jgi:hypothetical protein
VETCDPLNDCQLGPGDPCLPFFCDEASDTCADCLVDGDCDDGIGCTDDTCDAWTCVNTANDTFCPDDGLFCTVDEYCDAVIDCSSTGDPCPPATVCNEEMDLCDPDTDEDGIIDDQDNCPQDYNQNQHDFDVDDLGDVCDNCPFDSNPNQEDVDSDDIGNVCDN